MYTYAKTLLVALSIVLVSASAFAMNSAPRPEERAYVAPIVPEEREPLPAQPWGPWVQGVVAKPFNIAKNNSEVLNLIGALMHAPYILTADSTDPKTIKACASLAVATTSLKLASIVSGHGPTVKILMWDVPKMFCYLLSAGYDTLRIMDAPKVAYKNQVDTKRLWGFKASQLMQLAIEIVLRIMAVSSKQEGAAWLPSELADIVSIWRLLGRYVTYIPEVDTLEFSFTIRKNAGSSLPGTLDEDDEQEIEKLEELAILAEQFAAQHNQSVNAPDAAEGTIADEIA
jgi:hypothetical protein